LPPVSSEKRKRRIEVLGFECRAYVTVLGIRFR
jgi:hypothetical protein